MSVRAISFFLVLAAGCGGGGDDGSDLPDAAAHGGDGPLALPEGLFLVHEVAVGEDIVLGADAFGSIHDPRPDFYQLAASDGACRAFRHEPAFCGECYGVCSTDGECQPFPQQLSAGPLRVAGTSEPFVLDEEWDYRPSAALPDDLFAAGDAVMLEADGGSDVPAFSLAAVGTDPIWVDLAEGESYETGESPGQNTLYLDGDGDLVLSWPDPVAGARVHLELRGRNQGHGQPLDGLVICEADDTGELTVAAAVLDAFPPHPYETICQARDCPPSTLVRLNRDRRMIDGRAMQLEVGARRDFAVVR